MNSYSYIAFLTPVLCSVVHGDLYSKIKIMEVGNIWSPSPKKWAAL